MAERSGAPRVRIADASDASEARPSQVSATPLGNAAGEEPNVGRAQSDQPRNDTVSQEADSVGQAPANKSLSSWLTCHVPGHEHAALGAACGLLVALLVFAIGFFRTLFIVVLVAAGAAVGQFFDGDPRIIRIIRQIVAEWRR